MNPDFLGLLAAIHGGRGLLPLQPGAMPNVPPPPMRLPVPNFPMAPPAPQVPATQSQGSLWDRIQARLFPVPDALGGLLSPDDIASSRRSGFLNAGASILAANAPRVGRPGATLGEAVAAGIQGLQQGYGGGLEQALTARQLQQQEAERKRQLDREQAAEKAIQDVAKQYPITDQMTDLERAQQMYKRLATLATVPGAEKATASLSGVVASTFPGIFAASRPKPAETDLDVYTDERRTGPTSGQLLKISRKTGETLSREDIYYEPPRPVGEGGQGAGKPRMLPSGAVKDISSLNNIDRLAEMAESQLKDLKGMNATGPITGRTAWLAEAFRLSPKKAVQFRQTLANITSREALERSGAAVTPSEFERIRPYLPGKDDPEDVLEWKLPKFREMVNIIREERIGGYEDAGYDMGRFKARVEGRRPQAPSTGGTTYKLPDGSTFKVP